MSDDRTWDFDRNPFSRAPGRIKWRSEEAAIRHYYRYFHDTMETGSVEHRDQILRWHAKQKVKSILFDVVNQIELGIS